MPSKTISVTNGDGSTRTITIPDRSRFAGVKTFSRNGKLDDDTTSIQVTVAGHSDLDGIYTGSGLNSTWTQQGGNGRIATSGYNSENGDQLWFIYDDNDYDPNGFSGGLFSWSPTHESTFPWSDLPSSHNVTITPVPETVTVNRTAPVITSDRKGASRPLLSKVVGGAAAAYSLRDLNDRNGNNKVVRVRRASDNHERDFLAKEVSNGTLQNWVNTQTVLPLDIQALTADGRTGSVIPSKAAYSLRNLSKNYTGNVVDVRRSSDSTTQSFTASQVADGSLLNFVNAGNTKFGFAYFKNVNNCNVVLPSSFTLEETNPWSIKFGFIGETIAGLFGRTTVGNTGFFFATNKIIGSTDDAGVYRNIDFGSALSLKVGQHYEIEIFNTVGTGVKVKVDGVTQSTSAVAVGDITINRIGQARGRKGKRVLHDVRIDVNGDGTLDHSFAGDGNQASNWVDRVGSSNGTVASSVETFNNDFENGFVSKWYDQSDNTNHATQATPASQPKIVNAGVMVDKGIDFDGVSSQNLKPNLLLPTIQNSSTFVVSTPHSVSGGYTLMANRSLDRVYFRPNTVHIGHPVNTINAGMSVDVRAIQTITGTSGGLFTYFKDGSSVGTANYTGDVNGGDSWIGSGNNGTSEFNGIINEIIVYDTDQTDNRTTIEANIGEYYSISGIPAYDNTVDGFVEAWYDQSGNGNDLTQATASNQPTIVTSGAINTRNSKPIIKFIQANSNVLTNANTNLFPTGSNIAVTMFNAMHIDASSGNRLGLFGQNGGGNNAQGSTYRFGSGTTRRVVVKFAPDSSTQVELNSSVLSNDVDVILTYQLAYSSNTASLKVFNNGSILDTNTSGLADQSYSPSHVSSGLVLGARTTSDNFSDSEFFEVIAYSSDQLANRPAIEANINNQYEIY